jgi:hypothetical protein
MHNVSSSKNQGAIMSTIHSHYTDNYAILTTDAEGSLDKTDANRKELYDPDKMKFVITVATLLLWSLVVVFGLLTVLLDWPPEQRFLSIAEKVLLPLIQFSIVTVLSYVFGKPIVNAVVRRLELRRLNMKGVPDINR